jgi:hypothetical protein
MHTTKAVVSTQESTPLPRFKVGMEGILYFATSRGPNTSARHVPVLFPSLLLATCII